MKKYYFVLLGILSLSRLGLCAPVVGYGSSNAVLPQKNQELFFMGFEVALKHTLKRKVESDYLLRDQATDGKPLAAVAVAQRLVAKKVAVLAGFPTSHEAILAAEVGVKNKILTLFSAASHTRLGEMGPYVFSTGETMKQATESLLQLVRHNFKGAKGIVFSNPRAAFSADQEVLLEQLLNSPSYKTVHLKMVRLNSDNRVSNEVIAQIKSEGIRYFAFTMYPDEAEPILSQLYDAKLDLPIAANASWTTGDLEFLRRLLTKKRAETYSSIEREPSSPTCVRIAQIYKKAYGSDITSEAFFGYDLGVIVATVLNRVEGLITSEALFSAFHKNRCFDGTSVGKMCFGENGGHANHKLYFVRFFKDDGFVRVD